MRLEAARTVVEHGHHDTPVSPFLAGLRSLLILSETDGSLVRTLEDIELLIAKIFEADKCSIRLFDRTPAKTPRFGQDGRPLAGAALRAHSARRHMNAGDSIATREIKYVHGTTHHNTTPTSNGVMSNALVADGTTIGVITIHGYRGSPAFTGTEEMMLEIVALMLGKSLQLVHMHNLLKLRYRPAVVRHCSPIELAILFYEDLQKAGFDSGAVVLAASEVIAQVSAQLRATASLMRLTEQVSE
jgi:L-methionine (R)-S-oxide reductase